MGDAFNIAWWADEVEENNAILESQQQALLSQHQAALLSKDAIIATKDAEIARKQAENDNVRMQFRQLQAGYNRLQRENTALLQQIERYQAVAPLVALAVAAPVAPVEERNQPHMQEADSSTSDEPEVRVSQTASPLVHQSSFTTVHGLELSSLSVHDVFRLDTALKGLFFS